MAKYKFYVKKIVISPADKGEVIGYEIEMSKEAVLLKLPGATYELGINEIQRVQGRVGEHYILTPIELLMNLMNEGFKAPIEDKRGNKHILTLMLPMPDKLTTAIPKYKLYCETSEIVTVLPYRVEDGEVVWAEPAERYKGMYETMYSQRIAMGDKVQAINEMDMKQMKMGLIYSLQKLREQEIKSVAMRKAAMKQEAGAKSKK